MVCTTCHSGVPFDSVMSHANASSHRVPSWNSKTESYVDVVVLHGYPVFMDPTPRKKPTSKPKKMRKGDLENQILNELSTILKYWPNPRRREEGTTSVSLWTENAFPHTDQIGPVPLLQVLKNGYKCTTGSCADDPLPYCSIHISLEHKGIISRKRSLVSGVSLQTMSFMIGFKTYFEVPGGMSYGDQSFSLSSMEGRGNISPVDAMEAIHKQQEALFADLLHSQSDRDLVSPAFHDSSMDEFWSRCEDEEWKKIVGMRPVSKTNANAETKIFMTVVIAKFHSICKAAQTLNSSILNLLTCGSGYVTLHNFS